MEKSIKVIFLPSVSQAFELDLNSMNVNNYLSRTRLCLKFSNGGGKTILIKS